MSENNKFSLGGFPPIYEIVSSIKKKEFQSTSILNIQSIFSRKTKPVEVNRSLTQTVNKIDRNK
jgi:hypothetical protein